MTWIVALTTSIPMPSPGIEAMRYELFEAMMREEAYVELEKMDEYFQTDK